MILKAVQLRRVDIFPLETKIRSSLKAIQDLKTQTPPNYSAIKVNAVKEPINFREGVSFKIPERPIKIYDLTMINTNQSNSQIFMSDAAQELILDLWLKVLPMITQYVMLLN